MVTKTENEHSKTDRTKQLLDIFEKTSDKIEELTNNLNEKEQLKQLTATDFDNLLDELNIIRKSLEDKI